MGTKFEQRKFGKIDSLLSVLISPQYLWNFKCV